MKSIVAYVRNLLGWADENPVIRQSFKRDRGDDAFLSDDDSPANKRLRFLKRTSFPDLMANDEWEKEDRPSKNVRYVPIEVEAGHPSTSTPYDGGKPNSRMRNVPIQLVEVGRNGPATPHRQPRLHTPVRTPAAFRAVVDDDEPQEVRYVQRPDKSKKPTKVFIDLDEDDDPEVTDDDVIFVKKTPPAAPPAAPCHYFISQRGDMPDCQDDDSVQYYRLSRKNERCASPRTYSKFKAPPGITKSYRKAPAPVSRWMQPPKGSVRNKYANLNGNSRSTLSEVFNLDEKRNYQELIRRVTGCVRPVQVSKSLELINLAEDFASFRNTLRAQRQSLQGMKQVERDLSTDKEGEVTKEYDPITIASINSSDSEVEVVPSESSSSSARIDPINTLKDSFKSNAVTSSDWLAKLDSKYKKKNKETREKLKDARRESDIISKVNYEQKLAHLEHKLKHELSIPESLIEEPQPVAELPKLTPEQDKLVSRALGPGPAGQLMVEKFNLRIHRRDLQTLSGLNWLNDEVINFYMNLIMARCDERSELPRVYATNTFFYPKLTQGGHAGLKRWTRKIDIFAHDLMAVPVHLGVHWCMSLVDFKAKKISYLDSMGGRNQACLNALMQYLKDEHQDKKGQPFDDSGWKMECLKDIPQQMNGSDCGMFACTFAEFSARGAPYAFSQQHMPYLRRKAALEILQGKLML